MTRAHLLTAIATLICVTGIIITAQTRSITAPTRSFRPVTEAMLENPDPADWLNFRRTLDGWGYSPLNQINKQNAQQLQIAWSWGVLPGSAASTPLVSNGVMSLPNPGGAVQALDAVTGDLMWEFKPSAAASRG